MKHPGKMQAGFTMVELLVVIVIAAILASLAGPSFSDFINRTRLESTSSQLFADINRARSEAIKRGVEVLVCARQTDTACASGSSNWHGGWLVCVDADRDAQCDPATASDPNPLSVHAALPDVLTLTGPVAPLRFNSSSIAASGPATFMLGGTWVGVAGKTLSVAATGHVSRN